jgi:integrase
VKAHIETRRRTDGTYSYRVRLWLNGRKRVFTFDREAHAEGFRDDITAFGIERALIRMAEQNPDLLPTPTTVTPRPTLLDYAISHTESRNTKAQPEHRMKMRRQFERHLGDLGALPIDTVTREQLQEWCDDKVADGYKYKTIKNLRSDVSTAYKFAVLEGLATVNPVLGTHIDAEPDDGREPIFLKHWEFDAIAGFLSGEHLIYVETLVRTGMRKGEALALRIDDVDLDGADPAIIIDKAVKHGHDGNHRIGKTKTRAGMRSVTIGPELVAMLRAHIGHRHPSEPLFAGHGNDGTWQRNIWVPAIDASGLSQNRRPRIHDLRHTHASWLLADNKPLFLVSKRLGHKDLQTTSNIYGHLDRTGLSGAEAETSRTARRAQLHVVG